MLKIVEFIFVCITYINLNPRCVFIEFFIVYKNAIWKNPRVKIKVDNVF